MAILLGIRQGQSVHGSAGETRREVRLSISPDGTVATIGDRNISLGDDTVVIWHDGEAGTWHGISRVVDAQTTNAKQLPELTPGKDMPGVMVVSSSGGADIAAAVFKLTEPVAIVTSGYRGRSAWKLTILSSGNSPEVTSPVEYRARFAAVETL